MTATRFREECLTPRNRLAALALVGPQHAPKAVAGCYLAAFAQTAGAHLVTFAGALAQLAERHRLKVDLLLPG